MLENLWLKCDGINAKYFVAIGQLMTLKELKFEILILALLMKITKGHLNSNSKTVNNILSCMDIMKIHSSETRQLWLY
jgi:hypothetical protein